MEFPTNSDDWYREIGKFAIPPTLSHSYFPSGSKFSTIHFYALRIIYPTSNNDTMDENFPPALIQEVNQTLDAAPQLQQGFQLLDHKCETWKPQDLLRAGCLGVGLSHLQDMIIDPVSSKVDESSNGDSVGFYKIINSAASMKQSDYSTYEEELQRAMFQIRNGQTAKLCLVDLLLPVTLVCGFQRSVHLDLGRKAFWLGPKENPLYRACVDGVVTIEGSVKGLMEVKRSVHGPGSPVRLEESAQMAAYIYTHGRELKSPEG